MSQLKVDPKIGEKVWIEPTGVPVPYETRLRGGVKSGQRGHPQYPPNVNRTLAGPRVAKVTEAVEVVWSEWWRRRFNQGDIKLISSAPTASASPSKKKTGGDR